METPLPLNSSEALANTLSIGVPGYRIYLAKDGEDLIILYGGGTKNGQQQNIEAALALHTQYKAAKKAANKAGKVTSKGGCRSGSLMRWRHSRQQSLRVAWHQDKPDFWPSRSAGVIG